MHQELVSSIWTVRKRARASYEVVVAVVSVAGGVEESPGADGVETPDTGAVEVELTKGGTFSTYAPLG
jgi:hypothetical protein